MKLISIVGLLLLGCCFAAAQTYNGHGVVKYIETHRSDITSNKAFSLYFTNTRSFYEESILGRSKIDTTFTRVENGITIFEERIDLGKSNTAPYFYYFNKPENQFVFRAYLANQT